VAGRLTVTLSAAAGALVQAPGALGSVPKPLLVPIGYALCSA
jgi:hypothetical protein